MIYKPTLVAVSIDQVLTRHEHDCKLSSNLSNKTCSYQSFFYSPTDVQVNCLKNSFKIYIKIDIKTAPTCFGAVTPSSGRALFVLAKVTVVKIAN